MSFDAFIAWLFEGRNALTLAQIVAAFVTAGATWALWRVTRVLATETAALAKMTSQPFVVCAFEASHKRHDEWTLALKNTGNATAFDIKLEVSPPVIIYWATRREPFAFFFAGPSPYNAPLDSLHQS